MGWLTAAWYHLVAYLNQIHFDRIVTWNHQRGCWQQDSSLRFNFGWAVWQQPKVSSNHVTFKQVLSYDSLQLFANKHGIGILNRRSSVLLHFFECRHVNEFLEEMVYRMPLQERIKLIVAISEIPQLRHLVK